MKKNKDFFRLCPLCSCTKGSILHTQSFNLPKDSILPNEYDIVSCFNCFNCFVDTKASQNEYNKFYEERSKYEQENSSLGSGVEDFEIKRFDDVSILLEKYLSKNSELLDIGCANGGGLISLRKFGFNNLSGIDMTNTCVSFVKNMGFNAYYGGLFNFENIKSNKYDCVTLSHVIEHIKDLNIAIKNTYNILAEEGVIYIEVPDASRYDEFYIAPFHYFDLEHINHFDLISLSNLIRLNGFNIIDSGSKEIEVVRGKFYPAIYILAKKDEPIPNPKLERSIKLKEKLEHYIEISFAEKKLDILNPLVFNKEAIAVWGLGAYGMRLLNNSILKDCNIIAVLDADSKKHNQKINNHSIIDPYNFLKENPSITIVITSALYSTEIMDDIRKVDNHNKRIVISV